jgi:hypothetical protein
MDEHRKACRCFNEAGQRRFWICDFGFWIENQMGPTPRFRSGALVRASAPNFLSQMEDRQPGGRVHYRFWQRGGGYDRNLTEPKSIWNEIDYFHANPIRRGLCDTPTAWLWSSARELEQPGSGMLRLDLSSLPQTLQG